MGKEFVCQKNVIVICDVSDDLSLRHRCQDTYNTVMSQFEAINIAQQKTTWRHLSVALKQFGWMFLLMAPVSDVGLDRSRSD